MRVAPALTTTTSTSTSATNGIYFFWFIRQQLVSQNDLSFAQVAMTIRLMQHHVSELFCFCWISFVLFDCYANDAAWARCTVCVGSSSSSSPPTTVISLPIDAKQLVSKRLDDAVRLHQALNHVVFETRPPSRFDAVDDHETLAYLPTPSVNSNWRPYLFDRSDLLRLHIAERGDGHGETRALSLSSNILIPLRY